MMSERNLTPTSAGLPVEKLPGTGLDGQILVVDCELQLVSLKEAIHVLQLKVPLAF